MNKAIPHYVSELLFLNAGIYKPIDASKNNIDDYKRHMFINYLGVINSYEAFLPKMIKAKNNCKKICNYLTWMIEVC